MGNSSNIKDDGCNFTHLFLLECPSGLSRSHRKLRRGSVSADQEKNDLRLQDKGQQTMVIHLLLFLI